MAIECLHIFFYKIPFLSLVCFWSWHQYQKLLHYFIVWYCAKPCLQNTSSYTNEVCCKQQDHLRVYLIQIVYIRHKSIIIAISVECQKLQYCFNGTQHKYNMTTSWLYDHIRSICFCIMIYFIQMHHFFHYYCKNNILDHLFDRNKAACTLAPMILTLHVFYVTFTWEQKIHEYFVWVLYYPTYANDNILSGHLWRKTLQTRCNDKNFTV